MTTTPRRRVSDSPDPDTVAALAAAIRAGEMAELPPLVPEPKRTGGHPRASPKATRAVLKALDAGRSVRAAAKAGGVKWNTAKAIWLREGRPWPPPGLGAGSGIGGASGGRPATVTPAQARQAIALRGKRKPGGDWETSIPAVAAQMGVPVTALRRAIAKEQRRSEEERHEGHHQG